MNIFSTPRCGGCGAPRPHLKLWCRYCSEWIGTEKELALAFAPVSAAIRSVGFSSQPAPAKAQPNVPMRSRSSWSFGDLAVQIVCVAIFGVPVTFGLWAMISVFLGMSR